MKSRHENLLSLQLFTAYKQYGAATRPKQRRRENQQRRNEKANILSRANSKENMAPEQEERRQPSTSDLFGDDLYLCFYCSVSSPFDNYPQAHVGGS